MRPSHWLLASFLVFASVVTATGGWERAFDGPHVHRWVEIRGDQAVLAVERGEPVELFGGVVDRQGYPVRGAEVSVHGTDVATRTDAFGRFSLVVEGRRSRELRVAADGHAPLTRQVAVPGRASFLVLADAAPWTAEASAEVSAAPDSSTGSLLFGEGQLTDEEGRRVPFAKVMVRETGETVFADDRGHFHVPLPAETDSVVLVALDRDGRVARSKPFRPSRRHGRVPVDDLVLRAGHTVRGTVRDAEQRIVDGAVVVASDGSVEHVAVAGRGGQFWMDGLCDGVDYRFRVLPTRGLLGGHSVVTIRGDLDIDMFVQRAEDRRYRVVRGADRSPLARAHVVARWELSATYAQADGDGWVSLPGVAVADARRGVAFEVRDEALAPLEVERIDGRTILVAAAR